MTCDCRAHRRAGILWPLVLAVGICPAAAGCGWTPGLSPGPIQPASWLSSKPGSKAETEALKRQVEADSFPTPAEAGA
jgi:hypothetical protein